MSDKRPIWDQFLKNVSLKPDSIAINCADTGDCRTYFQLENDANNWRSLKNDKHNFLKHDYFCYS